MEGIREFKWSTGEPYEKSKKGDNKKVNNISTMEEEIVNQHRTGMISQPCHSRMTENKREENENRLKERELSVNSNLNPFMNGNDYVQDITFRDEFLRPKNSNYDK